MSKNIEKLNEALYHAEKVVEHLKQTIAEAHADRNVSALDTTPESPPPTNPHP